MRYEPTRFFSAGIHPKWLTLLLGTLLGVGTIDSGSRSFGHDPARQDSAAGRAEQIKKAEALNGPIFEGWPRPQLAILFSGEMDGYLEPCGCAGLENQKGGLKRRQTFIRQLGDRGWPLVALDMGGQVRRFGPQANIKLRYAWDSLLELGYQGIGLGVPELKLDTDALLYAIANLDSQSSPLVSANVALFGFDSGFTSRYRVIEAGGKRLGVTSVLGKKYLPELGAYPRTSLEASSGRESLDDQTGLGRAEKGLAGLTVIDPAVALAEIAPKMAAERCDWQVLLVYGDPDEAIELAKRYPQFQWVATTGGAEEPPNRARSIDGSSSRLIEVGHKGMYVVVIGLYDDEKTPMRFQRVPLDGRFADSPEMQASLTRYQNELKDLTLEGLGLNGLRHPEGQFVGSEVCADCHTEAAEVFEQTSHAHATKTLADLDPPRQFDPECLSCHVTGWDPQRHFPYKSGYFGLESTPHLQANGCENCHGPGAAHAAAESGEEEVDEREERHRRKAMRLKILANEGNKEGQKLGKVTKKCLECHDLDNSPEFDFQEYWPNIEHHGKD